MSAIVTKIESVVPYGENLSIVRTVQGNEVIANKREDGSFRWAAGEECVYVTEGSIIPDDVLKERGYWDEEKDRGLLDGGKRNRVKMKKLAGFESRGLLFKVVAANVTPVGDDEAQNPVYLIKRGEVHHAAQMGHDVSALLGITEFTG